VQGVFLGGIEGLAYLAAVSALVTEGYRLAQQAAQGGD
jgi:hypothetical protein